MISRFQLRSAVIQHHQRPHEVRKEIILCFMSHWHQFLIGTGRVSPASATRSCSIVLGNDDDISFAVGVGAVE